MSKRYLRILNIDWVEPHHQQRLKDTLHEVYEPADENDPCRYQPGDNGIAIHWPDCLPMMEPIMRISLKYGLPPHLALSWEDGDRWELVDDASSSTRGSTEGSFTLLL
jgi:hypothetical protein